MDEEHRAIHIHKPPSQPSSSVDSGSACRTPSDITKNVTFNPEVITVDATICEPRYSPPPKWRQIFRGRNSKQRTPEVTSPVANVNASAAPIKTILSMKRRSNEDVECGTSTVSSVSASASAAPIKTILSKRRSNEEDECFSRTEQLPLLTGLSNSANERTPSPCYVRRKKYVYPADVVVLSQQPNESTV